MKSDAEHKLVTTLYRPQFLRLTSLESVAIPKTRFNIANDPLSLISASLETYFSYKAKKVGRWRTGKSGNHSCKNMFTI